MGEHVINFPYVFVVPRFPVTVGSDCSLKIGSDKRFTGSLVIYCGAKQQSVHPRVRLHLFNNVVHGLIWKKS